MTESHMCQDCCSVCNTAVLVLQTIVCNMVSATPLLHRLLSLGVLQCVAMRCSALQCVTVCDSACQCVAVCCSVLQCVAVSRSVLQCVPVCCSAWQSVAVCCSVLQCAAVCCSVLQKEFSSATSSATRANRQQHKHSLQDPPAQHPVLKTLHHAAGTAERTRILALSCMYILS